MTNATDVVLLATAAAYCSSAYFGTRTSLYTGDDTFFFRFWKTACASLELETTPAALTTISVLRAFRNRYATHAALPCTFRGSLMTPTFVPNLTRFAPEGKSDDCKSRSFGFVARAAATTTVVTSAARAATATRR